MEPSLQTINRECFKKGWIQTQAKAVGPADPVQLERSIHAFELLGRLAEAEFPFVFKGGTCVLLKTNKFKRLSVDIDITSGVKPKELESIVGEIAKSRPFTRCDESQRKKKDPPRRKKWLFFYSSVMSRKEDHVILDVVEEKNLYGELENETIRMPFFNPDHRITVKTPSRDALLADKLTAFAPETVGVRYQMGSATQIIKQLFDIGELFNHLRHLPTVSEVYTRVFEAENHYRGGRFTRNQSLDDTLDAALRTARLSISAIDDIRTRILREGIGSIQGHLVGTEFGVQEASIAAGKAAILSRLLRRGRSGIPAPYSKSRNQALGDTRITGDWEELNRFKTTNPEAFYYWLHASRLNANRKD